MVGRAAGHCRNQLECLIFKVIRLAGALRRTRHDDRRRRLPLTFSWSRLLVRQTAMIAVFRALPPAGRLSRPR
jgi:hypothetical protein